MRELKLKVLDAVTGELIGYELVNSDGWSRSSDGKQWVDDTFNFEAAGEPSAIRVQYTALRDKNGVESYQSDVVEDDSGNRYVMEWNEKEAEFYLKLVHSVTGFSHLAARLVRDKRVIGNIYENPELLKESS